jgi:hypothetical protein
MRAHQAVLAIAISASMAGCGATAPTSNPAVSATFPAATVAIGRPPPSAAAATICRSAAQAEFAAIARRIYGQVAHGRNVTSAVRRVQRSAPLAAAVSRHDRVAAAAVLRSLLRHQITRIEVFDARGRRITGLGRGPALAPRRGKLGTATGGVAGSYVLSVSGARGFAHTVQRITGARVIASGAGPSTSASAALPRTRAGAFAVAAQAFPRGSRQIEFLARPLPLGQCGATPAQTRLHAIGFVARRLLRAESSSSAVTQTLRYAAHDPAFRAAVVRADPVAIRTAIIDDFFRNGAYHIVRARVTRGTTSLEDVGGPYVLAPASAYVRGPDGRVAGRFSLSVQDDSGYIKLLHRFTGADVLLRTRAGTVPGSNLNPGPPRVPVDDVVAYHGQTYRAYTFTGTAFPSGPLQISLLIPA